MSKAYKFYSSNPRGRFELVTSLGRCNSSYSATLTTGINYPAVIEKQTQASVFKPDSSPIAEVLQQATCGILLHTGPKPISLLAHEASSTNN